MALWHLTGAVDFKGRSGRLREPRLKCQYTGKKDKAKLPNHTEGLVDTGAVVHCFTLQHRLHKRVLRARGVRRIPYLVSKVKSCDLITKVSDPVTRRRARGVSETSAFCPGWTDFIPVTFELNEKARGVVDEENTSSAVTRVELLCFGLVWKPVAQEMMHVAGNISNVWKQM